MEIGKKTIAAAAGLFFLGGFSVYLVMANSNAPTQPVTAQHKTAAMQEALAQVRASQAATQPHDHTSSPATTTDAAPAAAEELTHEAFLAQAEARREERLINKEEADRLEKLKAMKERSVECKFWKQQLKVSKASEKVQEKINEHCNLPNTSAASEASSAGAESVDHSAHTALAQDS